jgi:hypothetical protein
VKIEAVQVTYAMEENREREKERRERERERGGRTRRWSKLGPVAPTSLTWLSRAACSRTTGGHVTPGC